MKRIIFSSIFCFVFFLFIICICPFSAFSEEFSVNPDFESNPIAPERPDNETKKGPLPDHTDLGELNTSLEIDNDIPGADEDRKTTGETYPDPLFECEYNDVEEDNEENPKSSDSSVLSESITADIPVPSLSEELSENSDETSAPKLEKDFPEKVDEIVSPADEPRSSASLPGDFDSSDTAVPPSVITTADDSLDKTEVKDLLSDQNGEPDNPLPEEIGGELTGTSSDDTPDNDLLSDQNGEPDNSPPEDNGDELSEGSTDDTPDNDLLSDQNGEPDNPLPEENGDELIGASTDDTPDDDLLSDQNGEPDNPLPEEIGGELTGTSSDDTPDNDLLSDQNGEPDNPLPEENGDELTEGSTDDTPDDDLLSDQNGEPDNPLPEDNGDELSEGSTDDTPDDDLLSDQNGETDNSVSGESRDELTSNQTDDISDAADDSASHSSPVNESEASAASSDNPKVASQEETESSPVIPKNDILQSEADEEQAEPGKTGKKKDKREQKAKDSRKTENELDDENVLLEVIVPGQAAVPEENPVSAGDLLDAYAMNTLDGLNRPLVYATVLTTGDRLNGIEASLYLQLKALISDVADGSRSSTRFPIPVSTLGLEKTRWTAKELGLKKLTKKDASGTLVFTQEALDIVAMNMEFDLRSILSSLLADCPYELYWYDKTIGAFAGGYTISGTSKYIEVSGNLDFCFPVVPDYSTGEYSDVSFVGQDGETVTYHRLLTVDAKYGAAVKSAVANAESIIVDCAEQPDYLRLLAYADRICALADYNDAVTTPPGMRYGNPWQIIWLFDGDPETAVVCESYSKGLQYLCDHSTFSTDLCCYCLMGRLQSENHMWNYVRMNDGRNYLVDLTNGDLGDTMDESLFLVGSRDGSPDRGYRIVNNSGTLDNYYLYSTYSLDLFTREERTLSPANYLSCQRTGKHEPGEPIREHEHAPTYEADGSYEEAVYCVLCGEELERSRISIPKKILPPPDPEKPESTADGILLRWVKVPDATGYSVYRISPEDNEWQLLGSTESMTWTDRNVHLGTTYHYMLRATVGKAVSSDSKSVSVTYHWQTEGESSQQPQNGPKTGDTIKPRFWILVWLSSVEGLFIVLPLTVHSRRQTRSRP